MPYYLIYTERSDLIIMTNTYKKKDIIGDGRGRPKLEKTKIDLAMEKKEQLEKEKLISMITPKMDTENKITVLMDESIIKRSYKLSLLGLTNAEIALALNIPNNQFGQWQTQYPVLAQALAQGREVASANVAQSLYKRAVGYSVEVEEVRTVDKDLQTVKYKKYFPPSVQAAMYWLNNRDKNRWGNVKKLEHGGTINHNMTGAIPVDLSDLTVEELKLAAKLGMKLVDQNEQRTIDADGDPVDTQFLSRTNFNTDEDDEVDETKVLSFDQDTFLDDEDQDEDPMDEDQDLDEE